MIPRSAGSRTGLSVFATGGLWTRVFQDTRGNKMAFALRMVWRETRPALKRFLFVIAAIALGVAVLTGLKGFSQGLKRSIYRSARDLIAADMAVRMNSLPGQSEVRVLESLVQRGARLTRTTETLSMV